MDLTSSARGRRVVFGLLYFAEGAPIGYVWWTLPVALSRAGLGSERIGALLGWVVLPWALKFLWAPLVDVLRGPRFGLRDWVACAQLAMIATLLPLAWIDPVAAGGALTWLLLLHAVAAATQDVAIDTLAITTTTPAERGALNGWMQVGMLTGRGLFGGAALMARDSLGDRGVVLALCGVLALTLGLRGLLPREGPAAGAPWRNRARVFRGHLARALARRSTWVLLLFAATGALAFESVGAFAGPFLADSGASDLAIGRFLALPAVLGLALGALAGGWLSDRLGRRRVIALASLGVSLAVLAFTLTPAGAAHWAALAGVYLGAGVMTSATYALVMDRTDPALGSTQFSAAMGATNLCEALAARGTGRIAASHGYPVAFQIAAALGILALPLLRLLGPQDSTTAHERP